jgi:hypothetical protein
MLVKPNGSKLAMKAPEPFAKQMRNALMERVLGRINFFTGRRHHAERYFSQCNLGIGRQAHFYSLTPPSSTAPAKHVEDCRGLDSY